MSLYLISCCTKSSFSEGIKTLTLFFKHKATDRNTPLAHSWVDSDNELQFTVELTKSTKDSPFKPCAKVNRDTRAAGQGDWKRVVSSDHFIMRQNAQTFTSSFFQTQVVPLVMNSCRVTAGNSGSWKEGGSLGLSHTLTWMNLPRHGAKPRPKLERALFLFLKCFTSLPALFSFHTAVLCTYCVPVALLWLYWKIQAVALQVNTNKSHMCFQFKLLKPLARYDPARCFNANSLQLGNNGGDVVLRSESCGKDCSYVSWTLLVAFSMAYADIQYQPRLYTPFHLLLLLSSPSKSNQSSNYGVQMEIWKFSN